MIIGRAREVLLNLNGLRLFASDNEDFFHSSKEFNYHT